MSDRLRSFIRTVMPGAWAALVVFLVKRFGLPPAAEALLSSSAVVEAVTNVVALAAVYAFARWVEPHLPDWLTRILLGSATAPTYAAPSTVDYRQAAAEWRAAFDEWKSQGSPAVLVPPNPPLGGGL